MNIGIFTDAYYPQINGVVISTQILKDELEKLGHKVTIITVSDPHIANDGLEDVLRLPSIPFAVLPDFRVGTLYSRKVMKEIKKLNLDIIHTQTEFSLGFFANIVSKRLDIPMVHTYHTMYEDYTHYFSIKHIEKYAKSLVKKFSKAICKSKDSVVVPTKKVEDALRDYGFYQSVSIIPTGVNTKPFDPIFINDQDVISLKKSLNIHEERVLLFVGRLAKEKSIDLLIESFARLHLKNTKMLIVGDGPERKKLEALSFALGIRSDVIFTGQVPWADIGLYYQLGHVFASASTSETQGLTFIEAMAANLPVLAKYDNNLDEVILHGKTGYFFLTNDELDLRLKELIGDPLACKYLGDNGYLHVKQFSSEVFGKSIELLYQETLHSFMHSS